RVLPLVRLRRLQQMLAHGLAVEVEFIGNGRHTPSLLLQIAYVHKILQVEHWAPWSAQRFHTWGFFRPALLGNFQPAHLGNFRPALTRTCADLSAQVDRSSPKSASYPSDTA